MTPKEFVENLSSSVIGENMSIYRDLFSNTAISNASDPYWKNALELFKTLTIEQRSIFFDIIHQITIDTTSNILGIIDGVNSLGATSPEFKLTCDVSTLPLNGDLQSLFLEQFEI